MELGGGVETQEILYLTSLNWAKKYTIYLFITMVGGLCGTASSRRPVGFFMRLNFRLPHASGSIRISWIVKEYHVAFMLHTPEIDQLWWFRTNDHFYLSDMDFWGYFFCWCLMLGSPTVLASLVLDSWYVVMRALAVDNP